MRAGEGAEGGDPGFRLWGGGILGSGVAVGQGREDVGFESPAGDSLVGDGVVGEEAGVFEDF